MSESPVPRFFASAAQWRTWLAKHHEAVRELWVGLAKVGSARAAIGYAEALDEALCFGWIDGQRRTIDAETWMIRFTPRQARSIWSQINLRHVERLREAGRMTPAGLAACDGRDRAKDRTYAFENAPVDLDPDSERTFRADANAFATFGRMPPSYRRAAAFWVMSAKRAETREARLRLLIAESAAGRKPKALRPPGES